MTDKMKIGSVEFDVIDTVSCHEICRELGLPFDIEAADTSKNGTLITKLNGKIRLLQLMKKDIRFYTEINEKVSLPEFKPEGRKQIARIKRKFKKTEKEAIDLCEQLGWITRKTG